nr:hypothetical protein [Tanacetum cinerariifolium]
MPLGANYLSHSSKYVDVPSLETIRAWLSTIRYIGEIKAKGTLKKVVFLLGGDVDFINLDSLEDDQPIIVEDEEEEEAKIKTLDDLPSLLSKSSPQLERELINKDKGKKAMSSKDAKEEVSESDFDGANLTRSMGKSSKQKKHNQFDFITEKDEHIHLTANQIKEQKKLKELAKADDVSLCVDLGGTSS